MELNVSYPAVNLRERINVDRIDEIERKMDSEDGIALACSESLI